VAREKKALIIIDMLRDFMEPDGALYCGDNARRIIPYVKKALQAFRKQGDLVIHSRDAHDADDREFRLFGRHCVSGTPGSRIIKELSPRRGEPVIRTKTYDSVFNTGLAAILRKRGVRDVFFAGVCTSICIMETASSLYKLGYRINILKKAVADFDEKAHKFALERIKKVYGARII